MATAPDAHALNLLLVETVSGSLAKVRDSGRMRRSLPCQMHGEVYLEPVEGVGEDFVSSSHTNRENRNGVESWLNPR